MIINFFTDNSANTNNISNLLKSMGFNIANQEQLIAIKNIINTGLILIIASVFLIVVFIIKIIWILYKSKNTSTKILIVRAIKSFCFSIIMFLLFVVCMQMIFFIIDKLILAINESNINFDKNNKTMTIANIPNDIYELITGHKNSGGNYLFPNNGKDFLTIANEMNWTVSILFVNVFAFFMIYIIWSIFQKMIEISFLYISYPFAVSFGQISYQINAQIWIKEIINKIAVMFIYIVFLRLYLYLYYFISTKFVLESKIWVSWNTQSNNNQIEIKKLYMCFFISLALGNAMIFIIKMFSIKSKEHTGIIGSINSFKQTRNFINQTKDIANINNISYHNDVDSKRINNNLESLKSEIAYNNSLINNANLSKIKLFNK